MCTLIVLLIFTTCVLCEHRVIEFNLNETESRNTYTPHASIYPQSNTRIVNDNCGILTNTTDSSYTTYCSSASSHVIVPFIEQSTEIYNVELCTISVFMSYRLLGQLGSTSAARSFVANIEYFVNNLLLYTSNINIYTRFTEIQYISIVYNNIYDGLAYINSITTDTCATVMIDNGDFAPIVGLAYVSGACSSGYKGFVVSTQNLELTGKIVAHEFGHVLGAIHDTAECGNGIMSPYISQSSASYSQCSIDSIESNMDSFMCMVYGNYSSDDDYSYNNNNNDNNDNDPSTIQVYIIIIIIVFSTVFVVTASFPVYIIVSKSRNKDKEISVSRR